MIEPIVREIRLLGAVTRNRLRSMRLHTVGEALSACQREIAGDLFDCVFAEILSRAHASPCGAEGLRVPALV